VTQKGKAKKKRENWSSKLGVILAVSGSAVGLGNFLKFPGVALQNGGGAFMIPYFISLFLVGIPLMWIEWTVGRFGGVFGHGTAPGIFQSLWKNRWVKYFGLIGIFGPLCIFIYYVYIESWLLGYAFKSLTGALSLSDPSQMFGDYVGGAVFSNGWSLVFSAAFIFFIITFLLNILVTYRGIENGIEKLSKFAMPALLILGGVLVVRVLTLGTPDPAFPERNVLAGLGYLWNPDWSLLKDAKIWLAAAGQIFFTLSVGIGVILTYASYLKKEDDVVLSGLTSVFTNEFCEVILGSSIIIPATFAFLGAETITEVSKGIFNVSFVTMPAVFSHIHFGQLFAFLWFSFMFIAALTSSVSIIQPVLAFLEDEFDIGRGKAIGITMAFSFFLSLPGILFINYGVIDELDFWGGIMGLVVFALIETIIFVWIFGLDKAWDEIHRGAEMRIPRVYRFIMKYITPTFLIVILGFWLYQNWGPVIMMEAVPEENVPYILGVRIMLAAVFVSLVVALKVAWKNKKFPGHHVEVI
jgi:NSS family neurotransmitter:Na+ symporter